MRRMWELCVRVSAWLWFDIATKNNGKNAGEIRRKLLLDANENKAAIHGE